MNLSRSSIVIAGIWAASLLSVLVSPQSLSASFPSISFRFTLTLSAMFFLSLSVMALLGPSRSSFYHPKLSRFIDSRYGEHTFESFLVRLKTELLGGLICTLDGAFRLWRDWNGALHDMYPWMAISFGLGLILMHIVLYRRRAIGVYPLSIEESSSRQIADAQANLPLDESIKRYWWALLGLAVLPRAMSVTQRHFPVEVVLALFFAVAFIGTWPVLSGKAPYSFWIIGGCLYLIGGLLAS